MGPSRLLSDRDESEPGIALSKPLIAAVEGYAVIARFPQLCVRADRASAYAGFGRELEQALRMESERAEPVLAAEARAGAARFVAGAECLVRGRTGTCAGGWL